MKHMKVRKYAADQCDVSTWFERDRQHVHLFCGDENTTVLEWWDEEVSEAVEDGFLDPRDWLGSALEYARDHGMIDDRETVHEATVAVLIGGAA